MVLMTRFLGFMMSQLETTAGRSMIGSLAFGGCPLWEAQAKNGLPSRDISPQLPPSQIRTFSPGLAGPGHRLLRCSRPRRPLDIRTVFFHLRRRSKMEILDEFDNESPLYISFCTRVSPEEFEQQSLSYTEKSLQDLYRRMEQNPGICESIVRKRKQLDQEEADLLSCLKAKLSLLFHGGHPLEMEEMEAEVEQLKREMQKASNYAVAAKRASQWPLARRPRKNILRGKFCPCQTRPPEPTTPPMPKIFGPYPTQAERSTDLNMPWGGLSPINQKR
nr:uncharacterized protein LOC110082897 [Pogona vitticeps]